MRRPKLTKFEEWLVGEWFPHEGVVVELPQYDSRRRVVIEENKKKAVLLRQRGYTAIAVYAIMGISPAFQRSTISSLGGFDVEQAQKSADFLKTKYSINRPNRARKPGQQTEESGDWEKQFIYGS